MSKSVGNVVRPQELVPEFGVDGLRFYLLREMTLGQDSSFSHESIVRRLNADLANDLGNLHSRITKMAERWLEGRLPPRSEAAGRANEAALRELAERLVADGAEGSVSEAWGQWRIHTALERILGLVTVTNEYLEAQAPWARAREPEGRGEVGAILLHAAEALRLATVLLWPVLPELAQRLLAELGQPEVPRGEHLRWGVLDGARVRSGEPIYRRIEPAAAT
jgi:methionyl-tRNA synthetase